MPAKRLVDASAAAEIAMRREMTIELCWDSIASDSAVEVSGPYCLIV